VLPLLAIAHVIGVRPIGVGHGRIVLLDAALHFGKQRFLQAFGVSKRALAIIVFGLQIGAYRRVELKRIAHHFAPVLRLEAGILVDETEVVQGALKGTLLRLWLDRRARGPRRTAEQRDELAPSNVRHGHSRGVFRTLSLPSSKPVSPWPNLNCPESNIPPT